MDYEREESTRARDVCVCVRAHVYVHTYMYTHTADRHTLSVDFLISGLEGSLTGRGGGRVSVKKKKNETLDRAGQGRVERRNGCRRCK